MSSATSTPAPITQNVPMFFVIALSIWTAMNVYVIWRVAGVPAVARHVPAWLLITAGVVLAASYLIARIVEALGAGVAGRVLEWIGAEWLGAVLLALVCFFVADLVSGFGFLMPRYAPAIRTGALVVAIILTLIATLNAMRPPVVRDYEVRIPNLPPNRDGAVLVVISDLHLGTLVSDRWLAARIDQIERLHPDLIAIAGDLVEGDGPAEREISSILGRLHAPLGVWAVPGNHERHGTNSTDAILQRAGIHMLRDSSAEAAPGLFIAGIDMAGHQHVPGRGLVERALAGRTPGSATILLSHEPQQVKKAAASGVGLMLSGHTHDGQIWPFGYFVRLSYRYMAGRYDIDGMPLIVCRGTGTWGPKMRLWYPNEMLRIVLKK